MLKDEEEFVFGRYFIVRRLKFIHKLHVDKTVVFYDNLEVVNVYYSTLSLIFFPDSADSFNNSPVNKPLTFTVKLYRKPYDLAFVLQFH